ncbi:MAG: PAS domain S-box protein [Chitinophagales bacterium]|nr:PAS domain S-box protein [Chitinophagales bacterium]
METTLISSNLVFTDAEIEVLKHFFIIQDKYADRVNEELTTLLQSHPLWGNILKMQTPEQQKQQQEYSRELQRAAIFENKWEEYTNNLIAQGITYARMNVAYSEWHEIIRLYKEYMAEYVRNDATLAHSDIVLFFEGMSKFIDYAVFGIAEAYLREKNRIITSNAARFKAIFESSADFIFLIDKQGTIQMVNRIEGGYKEEDIVGKPVYHFQPIEDRDILTNAISTVFTEKRPVFYESYYNSGNNTQYFSCSVSPILEEDESVENAVIIARDITPQKLHQIKLDELNASLEQKIAERTVELKAANAELEAFSYSVSHDLRAPLRAINGFTHLLLDECKDFLTNDTRDMMMEVIKAANKMGNLIDDLLQFSRMGKQEVVKVPINMNDKVNSVIQEQQKLVPSCRATFRVLPLENIKGDRAMLRQLFANLIANAIKYSGKKEQPEIEVGCYRDNNSVVYYVKDNGAGFDMEYYNKLFGVFQRLHSSSEFEGTGVGLALVNRIAQRHGGKVWAEGKVDKGATFYVSLPD